MAKDAFKNFVKTKPELARYVSKGEMTWQKFYELYDLYGENSEVWDKYSKVDPSNDVRVSPGVADGLNKITNLVKNVDMESIKSHIDTAQKAIDFMQDLTVKKGINPGNVVNNLNKGPVNPRPLNKFFED